MNAAAAGVVPYRMSAGVAAPATRTWIDVSFLYVGLFVVTLGALAVDERLLNGISVWIKPLKFQASLALHFATLVLLARLLPVERLATRRFRAMVTVSTAAGLFEIGWIMLQAGRGRASHFNDETILEQVMYMLMGAGAVLLVAAPFLMGVWLWRDYGGKALRDDPLRLSAALGLVLSAVTTLVVAGYMSSVAGAHWVGNVTTDAGGLPLVGWSQQVGDLRVAHFFASHGLQFLPMLGFAMRRGGRAGAHVILGATLLWLVFTAGVFLQALDGRPFLAPG